ncbi:MAG TPA: glycogen debranching protein GlgX [Candidatus Choladousia intestinavium]|uniref:Glycogen debranching protein GlgX n=1 Tax=Candidatus Choladousia intestinavium TaxID=2840727 RepID=A0A9D1A9I4_9FIRM|nr:glycogen debranching protein GlgX [Candidatus Choladousia intestinavium]
MSKKAEKPVLLLESITGEEKTANLKPMDRAGGFDIRPGFYENNGAFAIPGGVNFTISSQGAISCELLLFHRKSPEPFAVIPFPPHYRIGTVFSMIVFGLKIDEFEYAYRLDGPYDPEKGLLFDKKRYLLDPYARAVTGQSEWGVHPKGQKPYSYKARVVRDNFDWGAVKGPKIPLQDTIIYELHVRGFTKHSSSGVAHPGTFAGLMEKIPYLRELGVNTVELMPIFEFDEMNGYREINGRKLLDYWGYNPVCFFAPNTSYTSEKEYNMEGRELKQLIRALKENGMEVILDVVFNHTAEGNEQGPFFSFKGVDNNIYYMLTPDGYYYNYSGCGNTLNCNHPVVRQMILDCLRYWVINYRVDGFRFDLASILGRNEDGTPMSSPPLLESLAYDPILRDVDLIAEAWDAGGLYQVGSFPSWKRWAEWNGKYRDDMRSFLKGDDGYAKAAALRVMGSPDLYPPDKRGPAASVNFLTCHDGFTLWDLYSYNGKHNEANGWDNTDGGNDNRSWNCGYEGKTNQPEILSLRNKMVRNACAVLMCSRGTPMFLAGDEFGNSQFGNNNAYCQDNEISWLDWRDLEKNQELFQFFRFMIDFRKRHRAIREDMDPVEFGFPCMSCHGTRAWDENYVWDSKVVGVMFAGRSQEEEDIVYLGINAFWKPQQIELPALPANRYWIPVVDTAREEETVIGQEEILDRNVYVMGARSVLICIVKRK